MPDVATTRPGAIEPGSPEAIESVRRFEERIRREQRDAERLEEERVARDPHLQVQYRLANALERIADALEAGR